MFGLNDHISNLIGNALNYQIKSNFKDFGFVVDGPTEDPIANINAIKANQPAKLYTYLPFQENASVGQQLGTITPTTPEAAAALKASLIHLDRDGNPMLDNANNYQIEQDSNLTFASGGKGVPTNIQVGQDSILVLAADTKANHISVSGNSHIKLAKDSQVTHTIFNETNTGKSDKQHGFVPEEICLQSSFTDFANDRLEATAAGAKDVADNSNIYNTHVKNYHLKDTTVGHFDPEGRDFKPTGELQDCDLANVRLYNNYAPIVVKNLKAKNLAIMSSKSPIFLQNTTLNNSYLSDSGSKAFNAAHIFDIKDSKLDHVISNHALNCDHSQMTGSKDKPLLLTIGLEIDHGVLNYPNGAITAMPARGIEAVEVVDSTAKDHYGKTHQHFISENTANNKAYQKLAKLNQQKDNAEFENTPIDSMDNGFFTEDEDIASREKNALLDPLAFEANDNLFQEARKPIAKELLGYYAPNKKDEEPEL